MLKYPIIIPLKKNSKRLPFKNRMLIGYTLEYLKQYKNADIYLLTDDNDMISQYSGQYNIIYDIEEGNDMLYSINYAINIIGCEYAHFLCVTNPFREDNLLVKMEDYLNNNNNNSPIITTKVEIPNRKIFLLDENDNFIYPSENGRKGKFVERQFMIDGAAYLVQKEFINNICKTKMPNKIFWENQNFKCVENNVPFVDIDTQKDINNFNFLIYGRKI